MRSIARFILLSCVAVLAMSVGSTARGQQPQGRGPQPPPKNLQVLPKDLTTQQVTMLMRTFTAALGVQCDHCHVSQQDRASDDKAPKLVARKMLTMMIAINSQYLKDVGDPLPPPPPPAAGAPTPPAPALPPGKVTCYTCHRGALKPLTAPPAGGGQ